MRSAASKTLIAHFLQHLLSINITVEILEGKADTSRNKPARGGGGGGGVGSGGSLVVFVFEVRHTGIGAVLGLLVALVGAVAGEVSNLVAGEASSFFEVLLSFFGCHAVDIHGIGVAFLRGGVGSFPSKRVCGLVHLLSSVGLAHAPLVLELGSLRVELLCIVGHGFAAVDAVAKRAVEPGEEEVLDDVEVGDPTSGDDVLELHDVFVDWSFPLDKGSEGESG